jgi:hypothetical protein
MPDGVALSLWSGRQKDSSLPVNAQPANGGWQPNSRGRHAPFRFAANARWAW